jgi:hypothetical protein
MRQALEADPHYRLCASAAQIAASRRAVMTPPRVYHAASKAAPCGLAMNDQTTELEAAAFRRLLEHLNAKRPDVQNIDLMILAGFCRNCLADWYRDAAAARGVEMSKDAARERIYGDPFAQWKAKHQKDATPEQQAAFAAAQRAHG